MIVLFLLFLIQFAIAVACLAMNTDQQKRIAITGWNKSSESMKRIVRTFQKRFGVSSTNIAIPASNLLRCSDHILTFATWGWGGGEISWEPHTEEKN